MLRLAAMVYVIQLGTFVRSRVVSQMYGCYSAVAQKQSCKQRARKSYTDVMKCL